MTREDICAENLFLQADFAAEYAEAMKELAEEEELKQRAVEYVRELEDRIERAIKVLQKIEWVGSGAKGLIGDAIGILIGEDE